MPINLSPAAVSRSFARAAAIAVSCAVVVSACSSSSASRSGSGSRDSTSSKPDAIQGWRVYRRDLANTGAAAADRTITAANVHTLTKSWSKDGLTGVSGTPAVADGVAYFGDWKGTLWAVKAATGAEVWHTTIPGGFIVGAPAIDGDGVFLGNGHTLYRVNRTTGSIVWQTSTNENSLAQINGSPVIAGKLVLQTTAGIQDAVPDPTNSFRGTIGAYDKTSGKEVWRFYATPADATAGSGVGIWSTPAVDLGRGLLFIGTGNTSSEPTAPLADALLALDLKTGQLKWARQFTPRDVFPKGNPTGKDVDVGASPNLWRSNGKDFVGVGDKGGNYHALDRDNGKPIWQTSLTPGSVFGGVIGSAALVDGNLVMSSNIGDPKTNAPTNASKVFGVDPATGTIRWSTPSLDGKVFAPVTAVPGVAFVGTDAGKLMALSTRTGKTLWATDAPDKTGCGPSIVGGRLLWGYGFFLFGGGGAGGVLSYTVKA